MFGFMPSFMTAPPTLLRLSLPRLVRWGVHRVRLLQVEEALAQRKAALAGRKMGTKRKRGPNVPCLFSSWEEVSEKIEKHPFQNYTETVMSTLSTLLYFGGAQCMHIVGKEFFMVLSSGFGSI